MASARKLLAGCVISYWCSHHHAPKSSPKRPARRPHPSTTWYRNGPSWGSVTDSGISAFSPVDHPIPRILTSPAPHHRTDTCAESARGMPCNTAC